MNQGVVTILFLYSYTIFFSNHMPVVPKSETTKTVTNIIILLYNAILSCAFFSDPDFVILLSCMHIFISLEFYDYLLPIRCCTALGFLYNDFFPS